jgi:hypothetical protein
MRHKETVAVTITLPRALHEAALKLADQRECGNLSAVICSSLYKEVGTTPAMELKDGAAEEIKKAEARTVKYSVKKKRKEE